MPVIKALGQYLYTVFVCWDHKCLFLRSLKVNILCHLVLRFTSISCPFNIYLSVHISITSSFLQEDSERYSRPSRGHTSVCILPSLPPSSCFRLSFLVKFHHSAIRLCDLECGQWHWKFFQC